MKSYNSNTIYLSIFYFHFCIFLIDNVCNLCCFDIFRNSLESITLKQDELLSCKCTCGKSFSKPASASTGDDFINPDDLDLIIPTSAKRIGSVLELSDTIISQGKDKTVSDTASDPSSREVTNKDDSNETSSEIPRWRIIHTSADPGD